MITENLSTLKIHKLTQAQYQRELEAGRIDPLAIYLTPDEEINLSSYATQTYVDQVVSGITASSLGAQAQHTPVSAILSTASWSGLEQTVNINGITANNTVIVTPAPSSHTSYCNAGIYCSAQTANKLTFTCEQVPSINLTINVMILN